MRYGNLRGPIRVDGRLSGTSFDDYLKNAVRIRLPYWPLKYQEVYLVLIPPLQGVGAFLLKGEGGYRYRTWQELPSLEQIRQWVRGLDQGDTCEADTPDQCIEAIVRQALAVEAALGDK